jgi:alkanesulfonate monooxygenase SsuD/methylene tetrahydromethanopterin reductase-like flavin-dependent oxidoreductase (luciferase family)
MAAVFQNPGRARSDFDAYRDDLRLADLAEPLGFDSIWGVERHNISDGRMILGAGAARARSAPEAERNMRLFAKAVMPALQRLERESAK